MTMVMLMTVQNSQTTFRILNLMMEALILTITQTLRKILVSWIAILTVILMT